MLDEKSKLEENRAYWILLEILLSFELASRWPMRGLYIELYIVSLFH